MQSLIFGSGKRKNIYFSKLVSVVLLTCTLRPIIILPNKHEIIPHQLQCDWNHVNAFRICWSYQLQFSLVVVRKEVRMSPECNLRGLMQILLRLKESYPYSMSSQ